MKLSVTYLKWGKNALVATMSWTLLVSCLWIMCGCSETKGFLAEDDFNMSDPMTYSKRYTDGFLDMSILRKGTMFPSYKILGCSYTKQNLSNMVMTRSRVFGSEDSVRVLNRDGDEIGSYMIQFNEEESNSFGVVMEDGKLKTVTARARLVIPYSPQAKYLKIGNKKITIPE